MIINKTFENHEDLDINNGILVALPKPGKPKGPPQNMRPITLLISIRKVLSTIALTRIRPAVEKSKLHIKIKDEVSAHRFFFNILYCDATVGPVRAHRL